jgi:hypothetical protein
VSTQTSGAASPTWPNFRGDPYDAGAFEASMRAILESETLVVLTGLGTSLELMNRPEGQTATPSGAPSMNDLFVAVEKLEGYDDFKHISPQAVSDRDVELLLSAFQAELSLRNDENLAKLVAASEQVVAESCRFVNESTDLGYHERFLRGIVRRQDRLARPQLFTTNYDLAFEAAAERAHIHVIDGFGVGRRGAFDGGNFDMDIVRRNAQQKPVLESAVLHVLKLHGSVDWDAQGQQVHHDPEPTNPVLIYPASNKYQLSFRPPYLEGMSRWQVALRKPDVGLIVVGFGCNDAHITGPLEAALRGNPGLKAIFVSRSVDTSTNPTLTRVRRLIELGDRRVDTLASSFTKFVEIMPASAPTDAHERHASLVEEAWKA